MNFKEDDLILCTVVKIEGTTVFLEVEGTSGTMSFSEVSPGRIRNIREFVVPNKKVVCKVLRVAKNHLELSLRRVTAKEREQVMDNFKKEQILKTLLRTVLKDKAESVYEKIESKIGAADFLESAKQDPKIISDFLDKKEAEQMEKLLAEKKDKEKEVRKIIIVKSNSSKGVEDIKSLFSEVKEEVSYLGSSKFSITVKSNNFKLANSNMEKLVDSIKEKAKKMNILFETK